MSVSNSIKDEVQTAAGKGATAKKKAGGKKSKKSSILAQGPTSTAVRRSTRKRAAPSWISETPLASSTLTAAALGCTTATAKTSRVRRNLNPAPTPIASLITPKFDPMTPLNRTAMRTRRDEEKFLVSMNGSPVYVGGRGKAKNDNLIPVPIGNGQTLVIPADNPEVQPLIQDLIRNCMSIMNKK